MTQNTLKSKESESNFSLHDPRFPEEHFLLETSQGFARLSFWQ